MSLNAIERWLLSTIATEVMIIDLISIVVVLEKLADHLRRLGSPDIPWAPFGPTSCFSVVHFVLSCASGIKV